MRPGLRPQRGSEGLDWGGQAFAWGRAAVRSGGGEQKACPAVSGHFLPGNSSEDKQVGNGAAPTPPQQQWTEAFCPSEDHRGLPEREVDAALPSAQPRAWQGTEGLRGSFD